MSKRSKESKTSKSSRRDPDMAGTRQKSGEGGGLVDVLANNVGLATTLAACFPVLVLTNWQDPIKVVIAVFKVTNTFIRIIWPCNYCPASQCKPGFIYSPIAARMLATVAEFGFYYQEGVAMGVPFWN